MLPYRSGAHLGLLVSLGLPLSAQDSWPRPVAVPIPDATGATVAVDAFVRPGLGQPWRGYGGATDQPRAIADGFPDSVTLRLLTTGANR